MHNKTARFYLFAHTLLNLTNCHGAMIYCDENEMRNNNGRKEKKIKRFCLIVIVIIFIQEYGWKASLFFKEVFSYPLQYGPIGVS